MGGGAVVGIWADSGGIFSLSPSLSAFRFQFVCLCELYLLRQGRVTKRERKEN